jgi:hypothetical protein
MVPGLEFGCGFVHGHGFHREADRIKTILGDPSLRVVSV